MPPSHSPRVFTAAKNMPVPPGGPTNEVATPTPANTRMAKFTLPRRLSTSGLVAPAADAFTPDNSAPNAPAPGASATPSPPAAASAVRLSFSSTNANCTMAITMKNTYALISQASGDDQWKNSSVPSECRMAPKSMPMKIIDTTSDTMLKPSDRRAMGAKRGSLSRYTKADSRYKPPASPENQMYTTTHKPQGTAFVAPAMSRPFASRSNMKYAPAANSTPTITAQPTVARRENAAGNA